MFHLYVYDYWNSSYSYLSRLISVNTIVEVFNNKQVTALEQNACLSYEQLLLQEEEALNSGYEGLIARDPFGLYKNGRATPKSQALVKVKRFFQDEAKIIGFEELMHNANEAKTNELGHTERSGHKENLVGMNTLGALVCETNSGVKFKIGTGFSAKQRKDLWNMRESILGDFVTYKKFPIGEMNGVPRLPVILNIEEFIGIRMKEDMS